MSTDSKAACYEAIISTERHEGFMAVGETRDAAIMEANRLLREGKPSVSSVRNITLCKVYLVNRKTGAMTDVTEVPS